MTGPLWVLAVFSALIGFVGAPFLGTPFHDFIHTEGVEAVPPSRLVAVISTAVALAGIGAAAVLYRWRWLSPAWVRRAFEPFSTLVERKYFFDELYAWTVVRPVMWATRVLRVFDLYVIDGLVNLLGPVVVGLTRLYRVFDLYIVDGLVNLVGWVTGRLGNMLRVIQTGRAENYLLVIAVGVILIIIGGLVR